jgi:hypothetical protein
MNPTNSILDHINKTKSITYLLEAIREKLEKNDVVMALLCNLLVLCNIIVALKSWAYGDLTIEFVTTRLFHVELKKDVEGSNENGLALVVRTSKATFNNSITNQKSAIKKDKKKNLCNYCKKPRH